MENNNPWITFWPAWVLVNAFGWMSFTVVFILPAFGSLAAVCMGFLIGLYQWVVLNRYIGIDSLWVWGSVPAYGLLLFIAAMFSDRLTITSLLFIEAIILGFLSLFQYNTLRNYVNYASLWVGASPVAAMAGTILAWVVNLILFSGGEGSPVLFWAILGIVYGGITGITLIFLENSMELDRM
jgi:hypothetical protein